MRRFLGVAVYLGFGMVGAGTEVGDAWPALHEYVPAQAIVEAVHAEGLELAGIALADADAGPAPDDSVVLFVVLDERVRQTHWLIRLRGPVRQAPARTDGRDRATVAYGMDGRAIRFPARNETYSVFAAGPWRSDRPEETIPVDEATVELNAAFLDERFDHAAAFMHRAGAARIEGRLGAEELFTIHPSVPRPPDAAARLRFVEQAGLTDANERAIAATVPSLNEFARVVAETPGLRSVLFSVVELPSVWSLVTRFGRIETAFHFRSGDVVPLAKGPKGFEGIGPCFVVPFTFSINGRPSLDCTMLVTESRPPLRLCGGIFAVVASAPDRADARLMVRVLAARPGVKTGSDR